MIDHVNIPVSDLAAARALYEAALAPLGLPVLMQDGPVLGFGTDRWVFGIEETTSPIIPLHLAFVASTRDQVTEFYDKALAGGAKSNGAPGLRESYGPGYFAAYIIDPDGHNIEAVLRG